jgi:hypothetical protein
MISKGLDCGIAMLHFELGVRTAGATGSWRLLEGNDVASWDFSPRFDVATHGTPDDAVGTGTSAPTPQRGASS